jgi:hypothetical protein
MNLRNVERVKNQPIKIIEKPEPIILKVECNKENITAYLSDTRAITIPSA